ncbi:MAG TPA: tetratricopeptide repeat protein [Anaerolineales bacterium]|nr:tetratricopeptide repeat protein [Anaerolineales bacterium]
MVDLVDSQRPAQETEIENPVFQDAVEALRQGDKAKARELFTDLFKTDQNNATYWVWMSVAVDSPKERIYCLQTAFKLDPENVAAKQGLILLGALPADKTVQPFSLNRPRAWEEKLLLTHEKPKPKGWAAVRASPVFRLGGIAIVIALLFGGAYFGFIVPSSQQALPPTRTPGPSPTWTFTPTFIGAKGAPTGTPLPFAELLDAPLTPTPFYVNTPRSPITADMYRRFLNNFKAEQWDDAIAVMQGIAQFESGAADPYYYIGEAYRFKGNPASAIQAYETAIEKDPNFGAAYVGLARARIQSDPSANTLPLLNKAIELDPNFGEAYLERAKVKLRDGDLQGAVRELNNTNRLLPNSPLVFYALALVRQQEGELELAIETAQRASALDPSYMPAYLLLGRLYAETGDNAKAGAALETYLKYNAGDDNTLLLYGKILFNNGAYRETVRIMDQIISIDRNQREAYLYRFYANVELGDGESADADIDRLLTYYPNVFEFNIALIRAHLIQGRAGSALQILERATRLAEDDRQKAALYFWGGVVYEKRDDFKKAANYWQLLLNLPRSVTTQTQRNTAQEHLLDIYTATPPPSPTRTQTPTATKLTTPTRTPTPTPLPTQTKSG